MDSDCEMCIEKIWLAVNPGRRHGIGKTLCFLSYISSFPIQVLPILELQKRSPQDFCSTFNIFTTSHKQKTISYIKQVEKSCCWHDEGLFQFIWTALSPTT